MRDQLALVLEAARRRGTPPDHVLLSGPPGLGKTTLAMIVAAELQQPIRVTSGPAIQHAGDLASILSSLAEGEVLFLDEIHRMSRSAEEMLYLAMEDFRVDVIVGKGPGATAIPLELPPFTVVGATTRAGLLPAPLRDRFGFTGHLDFYATDDLVTILHRSARLLGVEAEADGIREIALRSRGTPRIANRLLRRVRDWAQVHGDGRVDLVAARTALALFDVDALGLDRLDRAVLEALCRRFAGGPVGLSTLAVAVGEETDTVETVAEPFLVREGSSCGPRAGAPPPPRPSSTCGSCRPRASRDRPSCRSTRRTAGASAAEHDAVRRPAPRRWGGGFGPFRSPHLDFRGHVGVRRHSCAPRVVGPEGPHRLPGGPGTTREDSPLMESLLLPVLLLDWSASCSGASAAGRRPCWTCRTPSRWATRCAPPPGSSAPSPRWRTPPCSSRSRRAPS